MFRRPLMFRSRAQRRRHEWMIIAALALAALVWALLN